MAINFVKQETKNILHDEGHIITPLYGKIPVVDKVDENEYTYFDTVDNYDLFINNTADNSVAIKQESNEPNNVNNIDKTITDIENTYNVDKIEYLEADNAILIKASNEELTKIINEYDNNESFIPNLITNNVLFLEIQDVEIQLEDTSAIDKLSDQDMKTVITKAGIKLNGTENKERLKGILQGALTSVSKN